jgi:tetratricopeptide (TPR) repeat protein
MLNWLRLIVMMLYAPMRALREVRDRAALAPAALVALIAHAIFFFSLSWFFLGRLISPGRPLAILFVFFQSAGSLVILALVFCPLALFLANLFERRASFRLLLQQEYSALAATMFYALTASSLITTVVTIAGQLTGVQQALAARLLPMIMAQRSQLRPEILAALEAGMGPELMAAVISGMVLAAVFAVWATLGLRIVFRLSWIRSVIVVGVSGALLLPAYNLIPIVGSLLASPFLLLMLFLLLRGYVSEITRTQRARESFRQNLEAATLNPADSSAHYNLGLIHQQRGELEAARERFERAVQIDDDEIDAHYQLGRIAVTQKRLADAVRHFEQVVSRDPTHAQHEIWREVGATYLAAGQFEDARNALERFLERRPSDPEALYLMGRAHAGMGHQREAASSMQACIEAVKTAPAYKYRADKRWLNEAQQFIKTSGS